MQGAKGKYDRANNWVKRAGMLHWTGSKDKAAAIAEEQFTRLAWESWSWRVARFAFKKEKPYPLARVGKKTKARSSPTKRSRSKRCEANLCVS